MLAQPLRWPAESGVLYRGEWIYERKLDGLRGVAVRNGASVELWSRNHNSFTHRFPHIVEALAALPVDSFVLDGEIVAFREGQSSFAALQQGDAEARPELVAFDVLFLLGRDTMGLPLEDRADLLRRTLSTGPGRVRAAEQLTGDPAQLLPGACAAGWEGLVAKRLSAPYRSGRSPDWRKLKCSARQELVIGGWTDPTGSRTGFGALLAGYYQDEKLRYAGRVGTGFDEATLRLLQRRLKELEIPGSAFSDPIPGRGLHFVRPELVAEVAFTEWTRDGRLRHPRFLGLRDDKTAREVVRESGAPGTS
jgi:DNA ligase D-like protein (predicted ligase)